MHHRHVFVNPCDIRWQELFGTAGMRLERVDYPAGLRQPRHDHAFMVVTVMLAGSLRERVGSVEAAGDGLVVIVRQPGVEHACDWGGHGARTLSLQLEGASIAEERQDLPPPLPWTWLRSEQVVRAMVRLYSGTREDSSPAMAADLVSEVLAAIEPSKAAPATTAPAWVKRAREAIHDAVRLRPSTRELAADAGITPVHFARVFRRYTGCSPTEYARQVRLGYTLQAMGEGNREIGRVAYRSGFYDHSHMCRNLRRSLDATPSVLRTLVAPLPTAPHLTA